MKIAFVAHRANYLKHYGPVIDAALQRGWQAECWLQQAGGSGKAHLRITPEAIHAIWGERVQVIECESREQINKMAAERKMDAIVSLHPRSWYGAGGRGLFITLQHSVDTFVEAAPQELASSDKICLFSPYWLEYAKKFYAQSGIENETAIENVLMEKVTYTGFAQMDAFEKIDTAQVRARWNIPQDQKVLLVLPLDLAGWPGSWPAFFAAPAGRKQWRALLRGMSEGMFTRYAGWALRGWNDEALAEAFKRFAEHNDAFFIIKGREKDPLRAAWTERADLAFYDDAHYPATIFEAMAIADLCVVFYSTAAQEAAYAGKPALCVDRPNKDMVKHKLWRSREAGGPYNYQGVVDWMSIPQVIQDFPNMSFSDFRIDPQARQAYLEKFNGPADHKASQRILDLVN
jgi:hypothetical protein